MHNDFQVGIAEKFGDGRFLLTKTSCSLSLLSHGALELLSPSAQALQASADLFS